MTLNEWIENEINEKFESQSEFARIAGIPLTTLRSALSRDFYGTSLSNAIRICNALGVNPIAISKENFQDFLQGKSLNPIALSFDETQLVSAYRKLNNDGQYNAMTHIKDLNEIEKYKKNHPAAKDDEKTNVAG